jgi:cytochrome c551/c552
MKKILLNATTLFLLSSCLLFSCNNNTGYKPKKTTTLNLTKGEQNENEVHPDKIKPSEIHLATPLNAEWIEAGKNIYEMKCQSCHKLNEDRMVGPGWKGITHRRNPAWIMNMTTNVDMMLENDPDAQKLLEQCMVRMPNQHLSKEDARKVLELMRSNDGVK